MSRIMVAHKNKSSNKKASKKYDEWLKRKMATKTSSNKYAEWLRSDAVTNWLKKELKENYQQKEHLSLAILVDDDPTIPTCIKFSKMSVFGMMDYWILFNPEGKSLDLYIECKFFEKIMMLKFPENIL